MTQFIAEIGSNHNGHLDRAHALVDAAAAAGFGAVKWQFYLPGKLFAPGIHKAVYEVPMPWLRPLSQHAIAVGLQFGCSVFDPLGVGIAAPHCDFLKVASYNLLDDHLLDAVSRWRLPTVLSTGLATCAEVDHAVEVLDTAQPITLLHCVSAYPTPRAEANLQRIDRLREGRRYDVGYSDHTHDPATVLSAVLRHAATMVELHFDLDGDGAECGGGHCWLPADAADIIAVVAAAALAEGDGGDVQPCEQGEVHWRADPSDGLRPMKGAR